MFTDLLQIPIVETIFDNLSSSDVFTFLSLCKDCTKFSYYIYNKFKFKYMDIENECNEYKNKIKHLIINTYIVPDLSQFHNLETIYIQNDLFNSTLDFIPPNIKHISINSILFNKNIENIYPNLKTLTIHGTMFNSIIDESLVKKLDHITIISSSYDQLKNLINAKYYISSLMTSTNNTDNSILEEQMPDL